MSLPGLKRFWGSRAGFWSLAVWIWDGPRNVMFAKQALERGPPSVVLDGGDWSFDFYMETKNIAVALDTHAVPKLGG